MLGIPSVMRARNTFDGPAPLDDGRVNVGWHNLQNILWPNHIYFAIHLCAAILVWERQRCAQMFLGSDKSCGRDRRAVKFKRERQEGGTNVATSDVGEY